MNKEMPIEIDYNPYRGKIVPKTNELIEKQTHFSVTQEKLFSIALRELQNAKGADVHLKFSQVCEYLGYNNKVAFHRLRNDLSAMKAKSSMRWLDLEEREYIDISVITKVQIKKDDVVVGFNVELVDRLKDLSSRYTKYFQDDFCSFVSKFSMKLYERLMELHVYANRGVVFTTEQLYIIFDLDKNAYMKHIVNSAGKTVTIINRNAFETRTIKVAVNEINEKTKCIRNVRYERVKKYKQEPYYVFYFDYMDPSEIKSLT